MPPLAASVLANVFARLHEVREELGFQPAAVCDPNTVLAELLDSMAFVELLAVLAADHGLRPEAIECAAGHRFTTVASLAAAVETALNESSSIPLGERQPATEGRTRPLCHLAAPLLRLPEQVQDAEQLDRLLGQPAGWLMSHAGIRRRHIWAAEDALTATADLARASLASVGLRGEDVGTLLVTSQAPPLMAGLAATLHERIGLPGRCIALEVGGACTGFLQSVWLASRLVQEMETVLIVAVEAPSCHLPIEPGEAGQAAALFGDGAAACLAGRERISDRALSLLDVQLGYVADSGRLLCVEGDGAHGIRLCMEGPRLASQAVELLAQQVRETVERHRLTVQQLDAVIAHAGNGRMPAVLARALGLPVEKVWSQTAEVGNLGSASLLAAWASRAAEMQDSVAWAAIGAGFTLASAFTRSERSAT